MKFLISLILIAPTIQAFTLPKASLDSISKSFNQTSYQSLAYDFEGIVKLSNCSGALVIFNGMSTSAKAVVMANGHCIETAGGGYLNPGEIWVNRKISQNMQIFNSSMKPTNIKATSILYAAITNTDVAFYELDKTYDQIMDTAKVRPFLLDTVRPLQGQAIEIISGYLKRGYSCDIHSFIYKLKEGEWTFTDSIRYTSSCDTSMGTSGAPIIAKGGERKVIAINNTGNDAGGRCTLGNPCEVDAQGNVSAEKGARYGQQTFNVYSCLNAAFQFDLSMNGCKLPH